MAGRRASRDAISREQWAAQVAGATGAGDLGGAAGAGGPAVPGAPGGAGRGGGGRRTGVPISVGRIVAAALAAVETAGFDALTMRSVAAALDTGPASLYAHVRNKAELGDLLIGELCSRVVLPVPDPARWQEQFLDICTQLRDQFLRYPGVTRAALAVVPADLATLRVAEGMLAVLLAGGASPQQAVWASDAAMLYLTAYCLEAAIARHQSEDVDGRTIDRDEIAARLRMLPAEQFPNTVAHARTLTSGSGHERFDFALGLLVRGLAGDGTPAGPVT